MWKKEFVGIAKFGVGLLSVIILVNLFLLCSVSVLSINSTFDKFNVTPDSISFNWTNGTINITAYVDNITIIVGNSGIYSHIRANYSQDDGSLYGTDTYPNLNTSNYVQCFNVSANNIMSFIVQNQTGDYVNNVTLNATNSTLFYLTPKIFCPPGRYWGNFTVYNASNEIDYANINATVNIPISINNTLNETTHSGLFKGKLPQYPDTYHSYYFNTSLGNASGLTIKLNVTYMNDVDLFLFYENGTLISQSINKGSDDEEITDIKLPATNTKWEIRVYGNTSSSQAYYGWMFYTVLNVTNGSGGVISSLDLGTLNASNSNSSNFTLENEASLNLTDVNQTIEIYHVDKWPNNSSSYSGSTDIANFFVPSFAQKIEVKVEWEFEGGKNITNWTLELRDNNGNLINTSQNKYLNANVTNGTRTEYIMFEGSFNTTNEGFWNISVTNHTNDSLPSLYNVTAYIWVNASQWLNVTLSDGSGFINIRFNGTGADNSIYNLTANLTIPNSSILNGTYKGFIQYNNSGGWKLRLPISFNVKAGVLSINNMFNESTYSIRDNIYLNHTRTANICINNTGGWKIYFNITNSSDALFYTGNSSYYINFTAQLPQNISAGSSDFINITFTLNTSLTGNNQGSYRGWIFFNTINATSSSQSYPYQIFNLSLEINLSDELTVNITEITNSLVDVTENASNVTLKLTVDLLNGTRISGNSGGLYLEDITNFNSSSSNITNINVTTYYKNLTNSITSWQSGVEPCVTGGDYCFINVTIPNGAVGGTYSVSIPVIWNTSEGFLRGVGANSSFVVNDNGLNVTPVTPRSFSVDEERTAYFNASVTNYGPVAANGTIRMQVTAGSNYISSISSDEYGLNCISTKTGATFTMIITENRVCWYKWKIITKNVSADTGITLSVTATGDNAFNNNITGITLNILDVPTTDGTTDSDTITTPTPTYTHTMSITNYEPVIYATLGGTNSTIVVVKHTGNVSSMNVKLNVTGLSNVNTTVSPGSYALSPRNNGAFNVVFNISNSTTLGNHSGTFKAYESGTSYYATKSFTLIVLSTPERESEINVSYENYTTQFENLTAEFERVRATGFVSEANLTRVGALVNETNSTINDIWAAIDSGDYAAAESLLAGLAAQLNRLRTELSVIQQEEKVAGIEFWGSVYVWLMVGIIIAGAAGLLIYMLLPPGEGYHVGRGYKPKGEGLWTRIKDKLKHKKKWGG